MDIGVQLPASETELKQILDALRLRIADGRSAEVERATLIAAMHCGDPDEWTQKRLAQMAGIAQPSVSRMVSQARTAPLNRMPDAVFREFVRNVNPGHAPSRALLADYVTDEVSRRCPQLAEIAERTSRLLLADPNDDFFDLEISEEYREPYERLRALYGQVLDAWVADEPLPDLPAPGPEGW